jgi:hypothetical protein
VTTALAAPTRAFAALLPLAEKARRLSRGVEPLTILDLADRIGFTPDPWQRRVLTSTAPQILMNCSRQSGKSTMSSLLALHTALYDPGALSLITCPTLRQSGEMMDKVRQSYHRLGRAIELDHDRESALTLRFPSGSRIVALLDEAAYVPEELYLAVRPMLAVSGGRLIAPSTPAGQRGWWYDEWTDGGASWERYHVTALECPRISAEFLARERERGEKYYEREFMGVFHETDMAAFRNEDIEAAFADVETWDDLLPAAVR